ncbi:hypothetical protein B0H15DRAFT_805615 [Mycena belliarum]|uniref:Uncharacterized protein n=1 Tax=Mycena belliarum TaxID=1033014 RepID=A0AAD6TS58_9AGAR|nr:hypothetical protein B0H15DRAFT_805615 [Mycena belliae]
MFDCRRPPQCAIGILGIFASALSGGPGNRSAAPSLGLQYPHTFALAQFKDSFRWSIQSRFRRRLAGLKASLQRLAAAVQNASQPSIESDRRAYFNFGQFAVKFPSHEPYDRSSRVNGWFTLKLALKKTMLDLLRVGAHKKCLLSLSYLNFREAVAMLALLQLRACEADTLLDLKLTAQLRCRYYGSTQRESPSWLWDVSITTGNLSRNKGETMPVYFNYYGNTESMPVSPEACFISSFNYCDLMLIQVRIQVVQVELTNSFALTCFAKIYWPPVALSSCTRFGAAQGRNPFFEGVLTRNKGETMPTSIQVQSSPNPDHRSTTLDQLQQS